MMLSEIFVVRENIVEGIFYFVLIFFTGKRNSSFSFV